MLREILKTTLASYKQSEPSTVEFRRWFVAQGQELKRAIPRLSVMEEVKASAGAGSLSETPWIGFRLNSLAPKNFRTGIYIAYLFSISLQQATLCILQGVTGPSIAGRSLPKPSPRLFPELDQRSAALRELMNIPNELRLASFDLGSIQVRGQSYVHGTICGKTYDADKLPSEIELREDLDHFISLYESIPADVQSQLVTYLLKTQVVNNSKSHSQSSPLSYQKNQYFDDAIVESVIKENDEIRSSIPNQFETDKLAQLVANDRRKGAHEMLVRQLKKVATANNFCAFRTKYIDIVTYRPDAKHAAVIIEVKSLEGDDADQARAALGQLFLYRFLHEQNYGKAGLIAAFTARPSYKGKDLVDFFAESGVGVIWRDETASLKASKLAAELLPWGLDR